MSDRNLENGRNLDGILNRLLDLVIETPALASVIAERAKQKEQWGDVHDDNEHRHGELADAAVHLIDRAHEDNETGLWWVRSLRAKYKNDYRKRLVIAAAWLLAEIERLDRAEIAPTKQVRGINQIGECMDDDAFFKVQK